MCRLKVPSCQAGFCVDRDYGAGKFFHCIGSVTAKIIRCRITRWHIYQAQFIISGCQTPYVGGATCVVIALKWLGCYAFTADVPGPTQLPIARIIRADHTRRFFSLLIVQDEPSDDQ